MFGWAFGPDAGNMTVDAPTPASFGEAAVTVEWKDLHPADPIPRGVVYGDGVGEIGRTVIAIDTQ